jgi:polysaccharide biosynthesis/export protein
MLFRYNVLVGLAVSTVFLAGCAGTRGPFVWVDQYPAPAPEVGEYQIQSGDMVSIRVWDHEGLSVRARVRTDGKVSVPLMDDLEVAGKTTADIARLVETQLKQRNLVLQPSVNVILEETKPLSVAVLGEVARAGMYTLDNGAGVAEALASAGGLSEFANRDQIFVIRRNPSPVRIRFTYGALAEARGQAATFRLKPGDVVVAQ